MRDLIKMVVVLMVLTLISGGLLAAIRNGTKEQIENQQLTFVKGPAIKAIFSAASNDPIADRFKLQDGDVERTFFVGKIDGKAQSVAFETYGKGFGGDIGLMVGVNVSDDKMVGAQVTTHSETPGLGSKAKDDPKFSGQFKGMELKGDFKVKNDGGQVDAISGATVSSRGVSGALTEASTVFARLKTQIAQKLQEF
ncbi:MAG: RnfABCDGE type electron transport complex subunit G [Eubacteriales bacterium]|nr:RnfABCDGE type electron transport complex subunit G [Eubacteriales bacterium]MDD3083303.1 RnfABCDGE type electron transport complex subunit G [Desulfobacterales bacterium]MDD3952188.1 RnfABCDGE type electron transport complex subunit G [Desulfobacterales bacterium]